MFTDGLQKVGEDEFVVWYGGGDTVVAGAKIKVSVPKRRTQYGGANVSLVPGPTCKLQVGRATHRASMPPCQYGLLLGWTTPPFFRQP